MLSSLQHTPTQTPKADPSAVTSPYRNKPRYSCAKCSATLALQDELFSKAFSGREGRALLMHNLVNVQVGKSEDRTLLTGLHTVADIYCLGCGVTLGWTYLRAHEPSQRYKEGKLSYIVETQRVIKENNWILGS
ncbi:yippee-domain-containing protein [Cantharellus anzutake]|uniref:yippee-domain-containing protein n=1 Tax=Cantharellus anzutake TaxID=1750568 RepID=UPI0019030C33|nr:yippee-domain-containing protein [Cantharellus anzutake]KAF8332847.1 yippee-domain-containing protein [Cantharellus anzutake]